MKNSTLEKNPETGYMGKIKTRSRRLFDSMEWPSPEDELWRRTNLHRLGLDAVVRESDARGLRDDLLLYGAAVADNPHPDKIKVRSIFSDTSGKDGTLMEDAAEKADDKIEAWHYASIDRGVRISSEAGTKAEKPVTVSFDLFDTAADRSAAPHVHLQIAEQTQAEIIVVLKGRDGIVNFGLTGEVGPGSDIRISLINLLSLSSTGFLNTMLTVRRGGSITVHEIHLGGRMIKSRLRVLVAGEEAVAKLRGLYVTGPGQHHDLATEQIHGKPYASSRALYKGIIAPAGRGIYQGLIVVEEQARQTDAYLTNNNLLLGRGARADSIPKLNIRTNDVKCSHGSTSGKINPEQLFYLMSRGLSEDLARQTIIDGFLNEIHDDLPVKAKELLRPELERRLGEIVHG
ncbi:MAG: SufD family Fe-S cluster assembly protein [Spirochaetales bacterium]|nr:SufD family Fe-S cluster assembly protein [Spirochaetales bacterium]